MTVQPTSGELVLTSVTKTFGGTKAVDDLDLEIGSGEFFSLLGPSGCGKTTTLRLVAGFERPDAGSIFVRRDEITNAPPEKRPVNTVFQHYALFPHMTVEDNVAYGLRAKKIPKEEAQQKLKRALQAVRLKGLEARRPRELSGGQQQRVALARALINEPSVLLLDEPLAALDLKLRKAMQAELKSLQERVGITFLYVTHDQEEALILSDRIAVMDQGKILQQGTPKEIYDRPTHRFVADFIGETNLLEATVVETGSDDTVVVRTDRGLTIRCSSAGGLTPGVEVSVSLRPEKIEPATLRPDAANRYQARVIRTLYQGSSVRLDLELPGGHPITMHISNRASGIEAHKGGDVVDVAWEEGAAFALQDAHGALSDEDDRSLVEQDR